MEIHTMHNINKELSQSFAIINKLLGQRFDLKIAELLDYAATKRLSILSTNSSFPYCDSISDITIRFRSLLRELNLVSNYKNYTRL